MTVRLSKSFGLFVVGYITCMIASPKPIGVMTSNPHSPLHSYLHRLDPRQVHSREASTTACSV